MNDATKPIENNDSVLNEELDAKPLKPEQGRQMADLYAYLRSAMC